MFDNGNHKEQNAAQPISIKILFYDTVDPKVTDHTIFALMLTNRLVNVNSDGKQFFIYYRKIFTLNAEWQ